MGGMGVIVIDGVPMTIDEYQELQAGMIADKAAAQKAIKETYVDISLECAAAIAYLRGTTRWSAPAEQALVLMSRTGQKLVNVYSGEL